MPRSAEEVLQEIGCPHASLYAERCSDCLNKAFIAFADERVKEANDLNRREIEVAHKIVEGVKLVNDHILEVAAEARAEALEEAAKLCEEKECAIARGSEVCECDSELANDIRALKAKP